MTYPILFERQGERMTQLIAIMHYHDMGRNSPKIPSKMLSSLKTAKLRNDIIITSQFEGEFLYETWETYKELLRKCSNDALPPWFQVQTFYNCLRHKNSMANVMVGKALMGKTYKAAYELLNELAFNNYQ